MAQPRTAYISLWFPKPSETFIFREVMEMKAMGLPVHTFALYGPLKKHLSREMAAFSPRVQRLGLKHLFKWPRDVWYWRKRNKPVWKELWKTLPLFRWGNLERTGENLWAFLCGFTLARRFEELGIQHIHSPWAGGPCTAALVASKLMGAPFSFAARAGDIHPPEGALKDKVAQATFIRVNNRANVGYIRDFAQDQADKDKVTLIYNAITLTREHDAPLPLTPPFRILALARFVRTKGFDVLLDACKVLEDLGVDFTLTMVGSGPWEARLRSQAKRLGLMERIQWPGFLSHDKVGQAMCGHDLFVAPSVVDPTGDRDGIPNVIMEAMVHALPVVATDVAGISEVVRDQDTGRLIKERDPQALAQAMAEVLGDPDQARAMAKRGQDLVLDLFDRKKNCETFLNLFSRHAKGETQGTAQAGSSREQ